jgi:hypothetical protein
MTSVSSFSMPRDREIMSTCVREADSSSLCPLCLIKKKRKTYVRCAEDRIGPKENRTSLRMVRIPQILAIGIKLKTDATTSYRCAVTFDTRRLKIVPDTKYVMESRSTQYEDTMSLKVRFNYQDLLTNGTSGNAHQPHYRNLRKLCINGLNDYIESGTGEGSGGKAIHSLSIRYACGSRLNVLNVQRNPERAATNTVSCLVRGMNNTV